VRLKKIIREVCNESSSELIDLEVMPDHVHLLVEVDPPYGIANLIRTIKGPSSRRRREEFRGCRTRLPSLWTSSDFVAIVGGAPLEVIEQQKHV